MKIDILMILGWQVVHHCIQHISSTTAKRGQGAANMAISRPVMLATGGAAFVVDTADALLVLLDDSILVESAAVLEGTAATVLNTCEATFDPELAEDNNAEVG